MFLVLLLFLSCSPTFSLSLSHSLPPLLLPFSPSPLPSPSPSPFPLRYELQFEIDPKYVDPHAAATSGWLLNADGSRGADLVLPYPVLRPTLFGYIVDDLNDMATKVGLFLVCIGTVTFFSTKVYDPVKGIKKKKE